MSEVFSTDGSRLLDKREIREEAVQMCARIYETDARHWSILQCLDTLLERGGYVPSRAELEDIRASERGDNTLSSSPER